MLDVININPVFHYSFQEKIIINEFWESTSILVWRWINTSFSRQFRFRVREFAVYVYLFSNHQRNVVSKYYKRSLRRIASKAPFYCTYLTYTVQKFTSLFHGERRNIKAGKTFLLLPLCTRFLLSLIIYFSLDWKDLTTPLVSRLKKVMEDKNTSSPCDIAIVI